MTKRNSFLMRSLALVLALIMVLSNANMGLQVLAAEGETISYAELLADFVSEDAALVELLESGYLSSDIHTIPAYPSEEALEVDVDTDTKTIVATSSDANWVPFMADVTNEEGTVRDLPFEGNICKYDVEGVYAVKVYYVNMVDITAEEQLALLNAGLKIQNGITALDASADLTYDLAVVVEAMDILNAMVEQGAFADSAAAIAELDAQIKTNGGELTLAQMNAAYIASEAQSYYLMQEGAGHLAEVKALQALVNVLAADEDLSHVFEDEATQQKWEKFQASVKALNADLAAIAAADWSAVTDVKLSNTVDYAELDELALAVMPNEYEQPYVYVIADTCWATWAAEGAPVVTEPVETEPVETQPEEELDPNYKKTTLYTAAAEIYGNDVAKAILSSGALKGDKDITVRLPDASGVKLTGTELTVEPFDAEFEDKSWGFYGLQLDGDHEVQMNNTGATITPAPVSVNVHYRLALADPAVANEIMTLAAELKAEADAQMYALDRLNNRYTELGDMNKAKINVIKSVVEGADFTPEDDDYEDAENLELVAYFTDAVAGLYDCLQDNANGTKGKNLRLYNLMTQYQEEGFAFYLANYEKFQEEVALLGASIDSLVADQAKKDALEMLLLELDYAEYIEYIEVLGQTMEEVSEGLSDANPAIDMNADLTKLIDALKMPGAAETVEELEYVYIQAPDVNIVNDGYANVQITVYVDGDVVGTASKPVLFGTELTAGTIAELEAEAAKIFNDTTLYNKSVKGELVEGVVSANVNAAYYFTAKDFTVTIVDEEGNTVGTQTINVNNNVVTLPQSDNYPLYKYEYTLDGQSLSIGGNTLTVKDCTIVRVENDEASKELDEMEQEQNKNEVGNKYNYIRSEDGKKLVGFSADIVGSAAGISHFAQTLMLEGYDYVELNGEALLADGKISLQTLINAILADEGFSSDRLIALGSLKEGESGILLNANATMFGENANVDFTLNITNPGSQIVKLANGLKEIKPYMTFKSNPAVARSVDGAYMDIDLTLPQPVYEVYLTALLAVSELDKVDMNAINNQIAFDFLYDYIEIIMDSDATAESFQNTIDMLSKEAHDLTDKNIPSINVEQYANYYNLVKSLLTGEKVTVTSDAENATVTVDAQDEDVARVLNFLVDKAGDPAYQNYVSMIKEYKEGSIKTTVKANLTNADVDYEAMLIDTAIRGMGKKAAAKKVYDFTTSLSDRAKTMGSGVVMLLDDVDGDVAFNGKTILDLNGKTINGSVSAKEKLIIVDTNVNAHGTITGAISGNVTILDGSYTQDVTKFLKDGYIQDNGHVRNAVYELKGGNIIVDTNFMFSDDIDGYLPAVHYMAVDLAIDLALNCYSSAALTIDNNDIYSINVDDLVAILGSDANSDKVAALVDDVLACFRFDGMDSTKGGIDNFINELVEDLLDLEAIADSIRNGSSVGDYTFKTQAWGVTTKYVADGDYVTFGIEANPEITKTATFSLTFDTLDNGSKTDTILAYLDELARIVVSKGETEPEDYTRLIVDIAQPKRDGKTLVVAGGAEGFLSLDFSHREEYYVPMLAIALSYADPEAFGGLVDEMKAVLNRYNINDPHVFDEITYLDYCAINDELQAALEAAIDQVTARDFFETLKKLANKAYDAAGNRYDLEAIAAKVEFKLNERFSDERIAQLEKAYDVFVRGVNKVLAKIDSSTVIDKPLSTLKTDDGAYMIEGDLKTHNADADFRGYGVDVTLLESYAGIKIKLFAEDCLWGDANHDGKVNAKDATRLLQHAVGINTDLFFCTKRTNVSADEKINAKDATMILQYCVGIMKDENGNVTTLFPAERISAK